MTLRALIVDDEAPARSELRYLLDEAGGVEVVGEASDASEAMQLIRAIHYDVVFLDVDMPGLSGVALADSLMAQNPHPAIIFVTAHGEHAVEAFDVAATDYLMKPVELERLKRAVGRLKPERPMTRVDRLFVEKAGRKLLVPVEDVFYVMAKDDYSFLFTASERYLSTYSLASLESRLSTSGFFRVHRRYLVNLALVREVAPMYGGTLLLILSDPAGTQVPVSRRRAPALRRALEL
jgi:two-component system response regulator LytT